MKTFKDVNGREYEWVDTNELILIKPVKPHLDRDIKNVLDNYPREYIEDYLKDRPVKPEPKYKITVWNSTPGTFEITAIVKVDSAQARLIKEAVEWLMRTILIESDYSDHLDGRSSLNEVINKARDAIQKEGA